MNIRDPRKYAQYETARAESRRFRVVQDYLVPVLLFGSVGAVTWAVRGTSGLGGLDGTLVPGMAWGLLWYYLCHRRGIDARTEAFWLGFGMAIGGLLGYGVYISWIRGAFPITTTPMLPIDPLVGYGWLWTCGAAWGGVGGVVTAWTLRGSVPRRTWILRAVIPGIFVVVGGLLLWLAPGLVHPHYDPAFYESPACGKCADIISTNGTNFLFLLWWIGALVAALADRDRRTLGLGAFLGVGFGCVFALGAAWTLLFDVAPGYLDWWKMWELSIGAGVGALIALALVIAQKQLARDQRAAPSEGKTLEAPDRDGQRQDHPKERREETRQESPGNPRARPPREKVRAAWVVLATAVFVFLLAYGPSFNLGVLLGLYDANIDQYSFPLPRLLLFLPFGVGTLAWMIRALVRIVRTSPTDASRWYAVPALDRKVLYFLCYLVTWAVISLWPAKICVFYVICHLASVVAVTRVAAGRFTPLSAPPAGSSKVETKTLFPSPT